MSRATPFWPRTTTTGCSPSICSSCQETYSVDGETLTLENGSYVPTAITFSTSTSGDSPLEYWEPSDGSYSGDIRAKFPADVAEEALNDQDYIEDLKAACYQQAVAAMKRMEN